MPTTDDVIDTTATSTDEPPAPAPAPPPEPEAAIEPAPPEEAPKFIDPDALGHSAGPVGSALPDLPIIPAETEMRALAQLANTLAMAQACPRPLQRKPNDVFLVLLTARDLGTAITTALREFHVIEGRVTLSPKVKLAMVRSRPDLGRVRPAGDNDAESATWHSWRADAEGERVSSTFTWEDAQLAHLVDARCTAYEHWHGGGSGSGRSSADCLCKSNWKTYPKRMLSWRSLGYLLDDEYPEIGTGLYSPDELGAVTDADGEPIEVSAVESLPGMKGGRDQKTGQEAGADEVADAETIATLQVQADRVKAHPEANEELKAWWSERELPPLRALPAAKVNLLDARLSYLVAKYELPEPGDPAATEPTDGDEPPQGGGDEPEPPTPDEPPADAPGGAEAPIPEPEPAPVDDRPGTSAEAIDTEVTGGAAQAVTSSDPADWIPTSPENGDLAGWLILRANAMTGAAVKTAYTVAREEPPAGNVQALRKAWAVWQFGLYADAVVRIVGLAFGVTVAAQPAS